MHKYLLAVCLAAWSSGAAIASDEIPANEAEIRIQVEMKQEFAVKACQAQVATEWYQKGASAHVEAELNNPDCGASSGSFVVEVHYRGDDGEDKVVKFDETWRREDSNTLAIEKDYLVADNVDITRVRTRKLRCECASIED